MLKDSSHGFSISSLKGKAAGEKRQRRMKTNYISIKHSMKFKDVAMMLIFKPVILCSVGSWNFIHK
jgi:hypothetical protein